MHIHIHNSRTPDSLFHRIGRDSFVDWAIILGIAFVISLVLISVGILAYMGVERELSAGTAAFPPPASRSFDAVTMDMVLGAFDERAAMNASTIRSYRGPGDPSL